jgi:tight adherence protein B
MFFYLNAASPDYMATLYSSFLGWAMLGMSVVLLALGSWWLSVVVKIKF